MRYLLIIFLITISCGKPSKQNKEVSNLDEQKGQPNIVLSKQENEACDSIHTIGLKDYSDFEELNQNSSGQIRFDQLDSDQQNLAYSGICQLKAKVKNTMHGELLRFPIAGGCLRRIVGIQDYSNSVIVEHEIDSLATKTFDADLVNIILSANENTVGLYVDKESNAVSGLTFTINESAGENEFGEIEFTEFYLFQRFKDGFFLTAVLCAG